MTRSSASQPDPVLVRAELQRLLQSSFIPDGSLLARMLTYVVERTLAGDGKSIKAYTIAVEALGRPEDFDPDRDSTVRVAAVRLRSALDLYYAGPGADAPLRIRLVPGSYRPSFEAAGAAPAARSGLLHRVHDRLPPTRVWLATISVVLAVDVILTLVTMAAQLRASTIPATRAGITVESAEKPAAAPDGPSAAESSPAPAGGLR